MLRRLFLPLTALSTVVIIGTVAAAEPDAALPKIVIIAGPKSHGPVGNGMHDYGWSAKLLKVLLDNSNVAGKLRVEIHLDGWPADPSTLDDAATIMVISDGRDGPAFAEAPHLASPENIAAIQKQIDRGCGFLTFHFSTFAPDAYAQQILDWSGGYFDWETDGERQWYSNIQTLDAAVQPATGGHPVLNGVGPFTVHEEFYYDLRLNSDAQGIVPIWTVPALPGREPDGRVVAWARERADGGRGFGTTGGHFYANWESPEFRRTILNALAWTAKLDVPPGGVDAAYYTHAEITAALAGVEGTQRAAAKPIKALILTGAQYPGHVWQDTTPALREALERDLRMQVSVSEQIEDLAADVIEQQDVLILNYCNWKLPGLSDAAKAGLVQYLQTGGGLVIVHFANGAFHFSLPEAGDSDWPEYRNICRRVWDHQGTSGHDAYGKFIVEVDDQEHPITKSLEPFETIDELYFRQAGDAPIHVLASARSQVTGQREPMAFVYNYGKGRVFQTVLGHAAESLRTAGTSQLICRAAAWAAGRDPVDVAVAASPPVAATAPPKTKTDSQPPLAASRLSPLADGRFDKALDAHAGAVYAPPRPAFSAPPLTVELWVKLDQRNDYNILLANESKASATHWELFTHPGNGHLTVYVPGLVPDHVHTQFDIVDDKWHFIAMHYAPDRIRLFVDGQVVGDQPVAPAAPPALPQIPGEFGIGALVSRKLSCGGLIDDVRISRGLRDVSQVPDVPLVRDDDTLALWRFDVLEGNQAADETGGDAAKWQSSTTARGTPVRLQRKADQDSIDWAQGFLWADEASRQDERWNRMQIGRVLASIIQFASGPVAKGMSIQVGQAGDAAVTYDTETMSLRGGWTGGFLKFDPTRFGLINPPAPAGELQFETPPLDGWTGSEIAYRGQYRHNDRVVLEYTVGGTRVLESPWTERIGERATFVRSIEVAPHESPLTLQLGKFGPTAKFVEQDGVKIAVCGDGTPVCIAVSGRGAPSLALNSDGVITATLAVSRTAQRFDVLIWRGDEQQFASSAAAIAKRTAPASLVDLLSPGDRQWPEPLTTHGTLGEDHDAYTVDTVAVPFDNPYGALIFTSGHDFFSDGRAAVSAIHGDVWLVDGLDPDLDSVTWKRFATGLFQPLGLKIVDDQIYVLGRDQITRLHDRNHDGEADFYENFASGYLTSTGGHDYVACLETDPQGNFYFAHGVDGVLRVPPSGGTATVVATGLRNPNGLGVGPQGMVTAAPQEGEWTPVSNIAVAHDGDHFGYKGPKVTDTRPLGYDAPLCWIPRLMDNSSGGQVWATGAQWGPLNGSMLHLSFGQCRALLTLMEEVDGQWQGGTVGLPWSFQSGAMRGRMHPLDGQMWVTGLKGWTTRAADDGCLQRVRYTGRPVYLPTAVKHYANGIALTFTAPLDPAVAQDPDSYHGEQWNYLWSQAYGSADYRPSAPGIEGHDPVEIVSATLLPDGITVFLEIKDLKPVMQIKIDYQLTAADGHELSNTYYGTLNRLPETSMPDSQIVRVSRQRLPAEVEASLKPGVMATYLLNGPAESGMKVERLPAFSVTASPPLAPLDMTSGFAAHYRGYIYVPLRGTYSFSCEGAGDVSLDINGETVLDGESVDLSELGSTPVRLKTGYNPVEIRVRSGPDGTARFRLLWEHDTFAREPVPPTAWFHRGDHPTLKNWQTFREGRELAASLHCDRCHSTSKAGSEAPSLGLDPPNLFGGGARLNHDWIARWLLNPQAHRPQATMPALFDANDPQSAQQAADLATYVVTLGTDPTSVSRETVAAGPVEAGDTADTADIVDAGETLYEQLACLACHRPTAPAEADAHDRISLAGVGSKYLPGRLGEYLRSPQRHHTGTRMPDFLLSSDDAASLAAFLESRSASEEATAAALIGDAERGRKLFAAKRCEACHAITAEPLRAVTEADLIPVRDFEHGCLARSAAARAGAPDFALDDAEHEALAGFMGARMQYLPLSPPAEAAERLIRQFNCIACHSRDGQTSPRQLLTVEEGSGIVPDAIPQLTWTGEKLRTGWLARFLAGERHAPLRPWLKARMPAFPAIANVLADGLRAQHGIAAEDEPPFTPDPELAAIGAKLAAPMALDCRQCHGVGPEEPRGDTQTLIALGVNFSESRVRLHRDYYERFVRNPPRCDPGLRMPILAPDGRTTKVTTVFGGDASQQFDALWHYLQSAPPVTGTVSE